VIIEKIRIENFKALKNVRLSHIPPVSVFVGRNGTGKTTLFRVFAFLKECLRTNVDVALRQEGGRRGFSEVITRGCDLETDSIVLEIKFRLEIAGRERLVTYQLDIGQEDGEAVVRREILRYKRGRHGSPFHFIDFRGGSGTAVSNEQNPRHEFATGTFTVTLKATNELGYSILVKTDFIKANEKPALPAGEKLYGGNNQK
jgi:predicted ATPase